MLDFTSSLYLGLSHGSDSLEPWDQLTLGRPAALQEDCEAVAAAQELAALVGCAAGTLLPSTFHLFWDLFGVLRRDPIAIYMDAAIYPIARWGAQHWAGRGVPVLSFPRHDARRLALLLRQRGDARPVVLCDGVCPGSTSQPPLSDYAALAQRHGGWLVIDDTQSLGVYGHSPSPLAPYGIGGGGSLRRHGITGAHIIVGASLAKGFGVPVALLAGSAAVLRRFRRESASREHMSPPSIAAIKAARHALAVNRQNGDGLRMHLWRAVHRLRAGLSALHLAPQGDLFPVQTLTLPQAVDVVRLHHELLHRGVRTVLHRDRGNGAGLSFVVTAIHNAMHIDRALAHVAQAWRVPVEPARGAFVRRS
jgi:8-amino-7-oxononanoate synthase